MSHHIKITEPLFASYDNMAFSYPSPPIPNSYWPTPHLCAAEYPYSPSHSQPQLDKLLLAGIRTFIDLTEPGELKPYDHLLRPRARLLGIADEEPLSYHRFAIRDRCLPPKDSPLMKEIMALLQECEQSKTKAVVHCRGGIGRTGTVVGCWLVQSGRVRDGDGALSVIRFLWKRVAKYKRYPQSPETGAQCEFVRHFSGVSLRERRKLTRSMPALAIAVE